MLACIVAVLCCYVWFAGKGLTKQPPPRRMYQQLAAAFLRGQLALLQEPDPALLALPNPYDPSARGAAPYPLDFSLYQGKFYLYFGPVPAVILAAAKYALRAEVGDEHLVFVFVVGLFLVQSILGLKIWKRFFPDVSSLVVGASLLAIGLASPSLWLVALGNTYGVSVSGGAFFSMAGLCCALSALDTEFVSRPKLVLASACWAAAVGSRITQVVPVVMLVLVASCLIIARKHEADTPWSAVRPLLALFVPLVLGACGLGWYNWARFGSVWETGIKYQLTGVEVPLLWYEQRGAFSPLFVVQNLFNYLLSPPKLSVAFPYASTTWGLQQPLLAAVPLPAWYHAGLVTGLIYTSPFIVFAALTVIPGSLQLPQLRAGERSVLVWLIIALWTAFLCGFAVILAYFWSAARFVGDFVYPLYTLSVVGFWRLGRLLASSAPRRALYGLLGLLLMGSTIVMSSLLATDIAVTRNPDGFHALGLQSWLAVERLFLP